ncbi:hypothetical protein [Halopseudomonas maritima]|uniref:hypothetical protein n=1 Tax=Halopseudomonas maritima TaxID=2918528 RepID=UPI001EEB42C6|nr:hypothetical protein [Halopseudomonas maritima]UJJ31560.1 hypothetical protein HV822_17760 [Halopseudomonas maritima]
MKTPSKSAPAAALLLLAGLLGGCLSNGSGDRQEGEDAAATPVQVTNLAAGRYAVIAGTAQAPLYGSYYAGSDSRVLVLNDTALSAQSLFVQRAGQPWQATPSPGTPEVSFLQVSPLPDAAPISAHELAGNYLTELERASYAGLRVSADGSLSAYMISDCELTGMLSDISVNGSLYATVETRDCPTLPERLEGTLLVDTDYHPARFRLVLARDEQVFDLWFYPD